jgi:cytoplasmic iron level regulating protein YaaA (DUF328/UPF0246 family)
MINLASEEYFKVTQAAKISTPIITPVFKDYKNGQYKIISFYAKRARGLMVKFAAEHQISQAIDLKKFNLEGYHYCADSSNETQWVFLRRID